MQVLIVRSESENLLDRGEAQQRESPRRATRPGASDGGGSPGPAAFGGGGRERRQTSVIVTSMLPRVALE